MRFIALGIAASLVGTAAFADETIIKRTETPSGSSTTVIKERDDATVTRRTTESTGSVIGCETKSVTKTDDDGDSTTRTKTQC